METSPNILEEPYLVTTDQDRDAITALHSICFGSEEWTKLQAALDDKNCFTLLGGQDEDGQPVGYIVCQIQNELATALWLGVRPERRGEGLAQKLFLTTMNEARVRDAEYLDSLPAEDSSTSAATIHMHKKLGFVLIDSFPDYSIRDGERINLTIHHFRASLMTI